LKKKSGVKVTAEVKFIRAVKMCTIEDRILYQETRQQLQIFAIQDKIAYKKSLKESWE
jgi:hypothetical protein